MITKSEEIHNVNSFRLLFVMDYTCLDVVRDVFFLDRTDIMKPIRGIAGMPKTIVM